MTVNTQSVPTPPVTDTVINLTSASQSALEQAINAAKAGEVTRIVVPKDAHIDFNSSWSTKDITDKTVIIDFNGAVIDLNTNTGMSFKGSHEWVKSVSGISTVSGNAVITFSGGSVGGLEVGDWLKVTSEDEIPGGRSEYGKMAEAMQVTAINGNAVTLNGTLSAQELYKTGLRAAKYDDGSVWLIEPEITGLIDNKASQIHLTTMVNAVIIEPTLSTSGRQLIGVTDTVNTHIIDPDLTDGRTDTKNGFWTYGVNSVSSKTTTILSTGKHDINMQDIRHGVDSGNNVPKDTSAIHAYGPDHDMQVLGLRMGDMLATPGSTHPGAWGTVYEDVYISGEIGWSGAAIAVRGRDHLYKNITVEDVDHAYQFFNEGNVWVDDDRLDSYKINIVGGSYKVNDVAFFTSGEPGNNLVDEIHFNDTYFESNGSGWFAFLDYAKGHWTFTGDTFKLNGSLSKLFNITGSGTTVEINDMTIDLSDYSGSSITLFGVGAGSQVIADDLLIINPKGVKIIESSGSGDVDIAYGTPDNEPYDPDTDPPQISDPDPAPELALEPAPEPAPEQTPELLTILINGETARRFDGNGQFAEIAHSDTFMLDRGAMSLSFKADNLNGTQGLVSKDSYDYDSGGHIGLRLVNGQLVFRLQSTANSYIMTSAADVVGANAWHNVTISWGPKGMVLYLDGAEVGTNAYTGGLATTSGGAGNFAPLVIGALTGLAEDFSSEGANYFFNGEIADITLIDQQLTPAQIASLTTENTQTDENTTPDDNTSPEETVPSASNEFATDEGGPLAIQIAGQTTGHFDGNGDFAEIAHSDAFMLDQATMTLSFKADDLNGSQGLISKDSFGYDTGGHFSLKLVGGQLVFRMQSTDTSYYLQSDVDAVSANSWHTATFGWGENGLSLYLDGDLVASDAYSGGAATTSGGDGNHAPLVIGAATGLADDFTSDGVNQFFAGEIANVLLFDTQVTPVEIAAGAETTLAGSEAQPASEATSTTTEGDPDGDGIYEYATVESHHVITGFDNFSGEVGAEPGEHDTVNLKEVFDAIGGVYSDGDNDLLDRTDDITLSQGDHDGDGADDDVVLTIDGADGFSITFVDPAMAWPEFFGIGSGSHQYDDIWV